MSYLICQIILCIILAFILGFIIGWLLKGWLKNREIDKLESECMQKLDFQEESLDDMEAAGTTISEKDDLKRISGVGPFLEKRLNRLGISTFLQIANLTNSEVEDLSQKIGPFPNRIQNDEWIRQAKRLHEEKKSQD
jgi:predicted flap endonuclease-1-like 5' DNA nuclease